MNKRILELAEQANPMPMLDSVDYATGDKIRMFVFSEENMQKFAELIVRSAMDYASRNWEHGHLLAEDLRVYFGVE